MKKNSKQKNKRPADSDSDLVSDNDFDPKNPFGNDEIENFYEERDKKIKNNFKANGKKSFKYSSDEEEVLAFDDSDEDEEDSDAGKSISDDGEGLEDEDEDDNDEGKDGNDGDDKDLAKWGTKKSSYYHGNKIENDEDAELEEEEAKLLQEKIMKRLDVDDFGLGTFKLGVSGEKMKTGDELESKRLAADLFGDDKNESNRLEKVVKNLNNLSKTEKIDFLKQESPELFELIKEFKTLLKELNETLLPIYDYFKKEKVPNSMCTEYIYSKTRLYLTYCCQLSFYFVLKSQRAPVQNHPVINNILQFRNMCKIITPIDEKLKEEIEQIKNAIKKGEKLIFEKQDSKLKKKALKKESKKNNNLVFDDGEEYNEDEMAVMNGANGDAETEEVGQEKRAINYQIEKNKGLTPKRHKKNRNPRVKNRLKARKALIKRKTIVRNIRPQENRYSGEATGIRSNVVRSIKFK